MLLVLIRPRYIINLIFLTVEIGDLVPEAIYAW